MRKTKERLEIGEREKGEKKDKKKKGKGFASERRGFRGNGSSERFKRIWVKPPRRCKGPVETEQTNVGERGGKNVNNTASEVHSV